MSFLKTLGCIIGGLLTLSFLFVAGLLIGAGTTQENWHYYIGAGICILIPCVVAAALLSAKDASNGKKEVGR